MHRAGLVERATVGLLREVAAGARGHAAGEPKIHEADPARGDRGSREEQRDGQKQLIRLRESAGLRDCPHPRPAPEALGVAERLARSMLLAACRECRIGWLRINDRPRAAREGP